MHFLFLLILFFAVPVYAAEELTAPITLHFSPGGNDEFTNNCRTASNPCKSLQIAYDKLQRDTDLRGNQVTFLLVPGIYAQGLQATGPLRGQKFPSQLVIRGSILTPSSVLLAPNFSQPSFSAAFGAMYNIEGIKMDHTFTTQDMILVGQYSTIGIGFVDFGYNFNPYNHVSVGFFGNLYVYGSYTISGGAQVHVDVANSAAVYYNTNGVAGLINVPIVNSPSFFAGFFYVASNASINSQAIGWTGFASGRRYVAEGNGVLDVGCTPVNNIPGNQLGFLQTGGQILFHGGGCGTVPGNAAQEMHIDAAPRVVQAGQTSTLSWRASGISNDSCWVDASPGPALTPAPDTQTTNRSGIAAWGQKTVTMSITTSYTLRCLTGNGSQAASAPLTVIVQP